MILDKSLHFLPKFIPEFFRRLCALLFKPIFKPIVQIVVIVVHGKTGNCGAHNNHFGNVWAGGPVKVFLP
jgi:hypothetical protein